MEKDKKSELDKAFDGLAKKLFWKTSGPYIFQMAVLIVYLISFIAFAC